MFKLVMITILLSFYSSIFAAKGQKSINGYWLDSDRLMSGMKVLTSDNQMLTVNSVWTERAQATTTYNVNVANHHTYFVGSNRMWAHNLPDCSSKIKDIFDQVDGVHIDHVIDRNFVHINGVKPKKPGTPSYRTDPAVQQVANTLKTKDEFTKLVKNLHTVATKKNEEITLIIRDESLLKIASEGAKATGIAASELSFFPRVIRIRSKDYLK